MIKTTIPIKGMHCKSCEILIGDKLQEIKNISSTKVSFKEKTAVVYSKTPLDMELVSDAIREAGYEIGEECPRTWLSRNLNDYVDLGMAFLIIAVLFFIGSGFGLFNINVSSGSPSNLWIVLVIGLTAGISTCMALIGGLVLGISARHNEMHPEATAIQKFRPHLYFNLGRIISYFILGGVIGLIGKVFQFSSPILGFLTIAVGFVMLILGLKLIDISPKLSNTSFTLPAGLSRFLGIKKHNDKEYSHSNSMLVGGLTFFLPCGFTQAMQLYAMSTGNFISGALIMGVFALGTTPGLLSIGGLTSVIKGAFAKMFFKVAGLVVIFLALFNISNGYNLTGLNFDFGSSTVANAQTSNVTEENGVQIARMTQTASGYSPNKFVIKKGVPVKWIINAQNLSTCSAGLSVPKLRIIKNFNLGENVIEFIPTETGKIKFTCLMGMYPGEFTVIENNTSSSTNNVKKPVSGLLPSADTNSGSLTSSTSSTNSSPKPVNNTTSSLGNSNIQLIKTTYISSAEDINPKEFTVKAGQPVRMEVDVKEDGAGCMSTIMIPGLYNTPQFLEAGNKIVMEFNPTKTGQYRITCAMGVPRGVVNVI